MARLGRGQPNRPIIRRAPASTGGTGTIHVVFTATGTGTKHATGSGTITATATLAADGTKHATGSGSITATGTLSGSGAGITPGEPEFRFAVDWNADGSFTGPHDDITERVLASGGFSAEYGRDQARALAPPAAGRAAFTLDDSSGDYSPENAGSPLAGDILPAREIQSTIALDGETHVLFHGHMDDYQLKVERNSKTVDITALDPLAMLRGTKISTLVHQGLRTDQAIAVILDAVGWPSGHLNANPYMTSDLSDWTPSTCAIARSTSVVHPDGAASMEVTPTGVSGAGGAGSGLFSVTQGHLYTASMWANAPTGYDGIQVHVNWYAAGDVYLTTTAGTVHSCPPGEWTFLQDTFTPPSTAAKAAVWAWQLNNPAASDIWYAWAVKLADAQDDPPYRELDVGATIIRWWWEEGADAWDAILKLVHSEGPGATIHANEAGGIVFQSRHHRLLSAQSTTSQATITDGADGYEPAFSGFTYNHGWKEVINHVTATVEERDPSLEPETVWESPDIRHIGAGETVELQVQTSEPVIRASAALDVVGGGSATVGLLQTSGQTLTLLITAPGSSVAVQNLRVTGQPVAVRRTITVQLEDAASARKYGQRSYPPEIPWAGVHDAAAIAALIIGARAERLPTVEVRIVGAHNPTRLAQQITRDLSDRLHIVEGHTRLDQDFFVEQIKHRVNPGGFLDTTFGLEQAAQQPDGVFTFDQVGRGFDDGVFGSPGLDEPRSLFIFDQVGHGFDDGLFAT